MKKETVNDIRELMDFINKPIDKPFRTNTDSHAYDADGDLTKFAMNDADADNYSKQKWVIDGFLPQSMVTVYPSPANGGKTAIFTYLCQFMAADGFKVSYINVDSSTSHLKAQYQKAKSEGWVLLTPDNKRGTSISKFIKELEAIAVSDADLSDHVYIFDVLKKMVKLMSKDDVPKFMALMKALASRGATIALLAHTNKYPDADGNLVFEGVGDIRSDCDNMVYLYSSLATEKGLDVGIREVTSQPDKTRSMLKPMSFRITFTNIGVSVEAVAEILPCLTDDLREMLKSVDSALLKNIDTTEDLIKYCHADTMHGINKTRELIRQLVMMDNSRLGRSPVIDGLGRSYKFYMKY